MPHCSSWRVGCVWVSCGFVKEFLSSSSRPLATLMPYCLLKNGFLHAKERKKINKKRRVEQNKTTILHNSFHRPIQPYSPKLDISNSPLGDHG